MNPVVNALIFSAVIVGALIAYCQIRGCDCPNCRRG